MITPEVETDPKSFPRVRVVIPCRNEARFIGPCLLSLVAADRSNMHLEVCVCDGMSDDGTREEIKGIASVHPWIKLMDNPARTTPQAMNIGLRPEGFDIGIILGAHAEVDKEFLKENMALLRDHPEVGCAGGVIENVYVDEASRRIGAAMGHPFGVGGAHFRTGRKEGEVDTVAFGAYRREVFDQVGFFDERLVRNQDDEFNYRVTQAGWRIRLSYKIRSKYYVRASLGRLFRQYRQYGYWKVYVNRLHRAITTWRQLVPAALVAFLSLGPAISWTGPIAFGLFLAGVTGYVLVAFVSAFRSASQVKDIPGIMATFFVLHVSYGIGYWHGIFDLILLRREPLSKAHALTR